jgi:hypothetical protein
MDADDLKYEAGDPVAAAEGFAATHSAAGYPLDFSLASLEDQVDRLLGLPIFRHGREGLPTDAEERNEAALAAYIGETLRRLFDGEWIGSFYPRSQALNFYESFVMFGGFRFEPHLFVGYWLANGEGEGSFRSYLRSVLQRIAARVPAGDPHVNPQSLGVITPPVSGE